MKDKTIDYVLRSTWQAVTRMYNEEAQKFDSTMATGFTLLSVDPEHGSPSTTLGPRMGMEATSLSRILKNMETKGLIYRTPNPEDGRGVIIRLTPLGKEKRDISREVVLRFNDMVRSQVSERDLQGFYNVSQTIHELITEKKIYQNKD
ncbi:MarR family transcriptional regulator [Robertkochia marina]|uniref:MarR family transcriptional regulator n=1 Tax=Robertkochia marina TaxID=1227945 RepID=A0A4S3M1M9_9FLAO|nr:MarR family transcriptional regulator [Robertkochia marina]THD68098.1 MarR family transcriptional regulator [Robertkochia marina]TRZ44689.1 MarR family transcriptional regulator [Robertkochia marina]